MKSSIGSMLCLASFLIIFSACKKDQPISELTIQERTYPNVSELLWDYFERFEDAAAERGHVIDLNAEGITGEIMEIEQDRVAGSCSFSSHAPNHVTIDLEFWNESNDLYKEFVIFHELGHCSLFRGHREDSHANDSYFWVVSQFSGIEMKDAYRSYTLMTGLQGLVVVVITLLLFFIFSA